jgi:DNA-binding winged helix-turn-helix (wHTH) protein/Tol biopolymer transport system component
VEFTPSLSKIELHFRTLDLLLLATSNSVPTGAQFGRYSVDLNSGELLRSGVRVPIQGQPFQVLRLLLQEEGRVVTREALRKALWPEDTFVDFELGVNTAVKKLRQALEDSAEHPQFIETLPKFGYRFLVPVEWLTDEGGNRALLDILPIPSLDLKPVPPPIAPKRRWKLKSVLALTASAILVSALFFSNANAYKRLGMLLRHVVTGNHPEPRPALHQRRLTANPENMPVSSSVLSPDGKYLAYTDASGFYLRQIDGGETHAVPLPRGFHALPQSWFPDSVHLVVSWVEDSKSPPSLWKISVMGGTPHKLADEGTFASVSPDGSKIAFLAGMWNNQGIWLMQSDGNGARKIVDSGKHHFGAATWAPDGNRFAYVREIDNYGSDRANRQIEVYGLTNGRTEVILSEPRLGSELAWINTGCLIYSLQEDQPNQGDFNLWEVKVDPRTGLLSGSPTRITSDGGPSPRISVAVDGKRMALLRRLFQADVYLSELNAQADRLSTPRRLTLDERQDFPTSWTPDSKAVLFTSDRDGPYHIFKQHIDQTQPEVLVGGSNNLGAPRLTPDGSSVLYAKLGDPSGIASLMRVPLSGGPSEFVLEIRGFTDYQCAKLPSTLCIYGQIEPKTEYHRFFTFDPNAGKPTEIFAAKIKVEEGPNNWGLSPDGKYLVTSKPQSHRLRILRLADGTIRYIPVSGLGIVINMDWAADSKSVWVGGFMRRDSWDKRAGLLNVDLTGRTRVMLEKANPMILYAVPSRDGHRLALIGYTESSNVTLLENF